MATCEHRPFYRRLLIILCVIITASCINCETLNLFVFENQPSETLLGNIDEGAGFLEAIGASNKSQLKFKFFTQGNPQTRYFTVNELTGDIYTTQSLDREALCPNNARVSCDLDLDVASYSKNFFKIFRVRVIVKDINDNAPEFPEPEIHISVPESVAINYTVTISGARDEDTGGNNAVQTYELVPVNNMFGINVIKNLDGTPEIGIVVKKKLDRENMAFYQMRVLAKDGGSPQKTGTVTVNIVVSDVNDHSPMFTKSLYNVTVRENLSVNTPVVRVTASDKDVGVNGQVKFRFSSRTIAKYSEMFSVNGTTGEILVKGKLDYEDVNLYRLVVEAYDQGSQSESSQALVVVNLLDVNDNAPELNFNFLSGLDRAEIPENANLYDFVAHISVVDKDSENNAAVDCKTDSVTFRIERLYANEFQVILTSKLDRESKSEYEVTVNCRDMGIMSLDNSRAFMVTVLDENDNEPTFLLPYYKITISESISAGEEVISVSATDADVGANGEITYRLFGVDSSNYFTIHETTGVITIDESLDFETVSSMTVYIHARDGGSPFLFTSVALDVTVLDVNDELPQFNDSSYVFDVLEETPIGTTVGKVFATDADQLPGGGVIYSIIETSATRGMFVISETDGTIRTSEVIDREEVPIVNLTILAFDSRLPSQNSSVEVTVHLLDINDHTPIINYPSDVNNTFIVSKKQSRDIPLVTILASDLDFGRNGTLFYDILNTDTYNMFSIDHERGDIFFDESFKTSVRKTVTLSIAVNDQGSPRRRAMARLYVILEPTNQSESSAGISNSNMVVVVIVVSITCVLSVLILIGICCVRRQYMKRPSTEATTNRDPEVYSSWEGNCSTENLPNGDFSNRSQEKGESHDNPCCSTSDEVSETIEKEQTSQHVHIPWVHSSKAIVQKRLDISVSPIDIFDLAQYGHTGIWLNYLRRTENTHPRTSSTNSRYTTDSASNMSTDTVASDSGRGGSEQDSREHDHQHDGCLTPLAICPPDQSLEGDYMDMQKSPLSSIAALEKSDHLYNNIPLPYEKYLLNRGMIRDTNRTSLCERSEIKADNPYTAMSPICSKRLDFSLKSEELSVIELNNHDAQTFKPHVLVNNIQRENVSTNSAIPVCYNRQGSLTDEDDDVTTTSGSYTVDLRDFAEFEETHPRVNFLEVEV